MMRVFLLIGSRAKTPKPWTRERRRTILGVARALHLINAKRPMRTEDSMFGLNIVDHVRLNLTRASDNYTVHARAAERYARITWYSRLSVLALLLAAASASALHIAMNGRGSEIAAVVAASLALAGYVVSIGLGFEGRVSAHRLCAHNLWLVCERHRALLAEIADGLLDQEAILRRRDDLAHATHQAYAIAFPLDQGAYEALRLPTADQLRAEFTHAQTGPLSASSS